MNSDVAWLENLFATDPFTRIFGMIFLAHIMYSLCVGEYWGKVPGQYSWSLIPKEVTSASKNPLYFSFLISIESIAAINCLVRLNQIFPSYNNQWLLSFQIWLFIWFLLYFYFVLLYRTNKRQ